MASRALRMFVPTTSVRCAKVLVVEYVGLRASMVKVADGRYRETFRFVLGEEKHIQDTILAVEQEINTRCYQYLCIIWMGLPRSPPSII